MGTQVKWRTHIPYKGGSCYLPKQKHKYNDARSSKFSRELETQIFIYLLILTYWQQYLKKKKKTTVWAKKREPSVDQLCLKLSLGILNEYTRASLRACNGNIA